MYTFHLSRVWCNQIAAFKITFKRQAVVVLTVNMDIIEIDSCGDSFINFISIVSPIQTTAEAISYNNLREKQ